jgi:hypothetical protein
LQAILAETFFTFDYLLHSFEADTSSVTSDGRIRGACIWSGDTGRNFLSTFDYLLHPFEADRGSVTSDVRIRGACI